MIVKQFFMKKIFYLAIPALLALGACSQDSVVEVKEGNAISFAPVASKSLRTAENHTTAGLTEFNTSAFSGDNALFNNEKVSKNGSAWKTENTYFWPTKGTLSFYSYAPLDFTKSNATVEVTSSNKQIKDFTIPYESKDQQDPIYAVNAYEKFSDHLNAPVEVNFRHATSRILFKAKNTNPNLKIEISGVRIAYIKGKGTFTFPEETTKTHLSSDTHYLTEEDATWGKWNLVDDSFTYTKATTVYNVGRTGRGNFLTLEGKTDEAQLISTDEASWLQVLPQEVTGWDPVSDPRNDKNGAYFLVQCYIYQKVKNSAGEDVWASLFAGRISKFSYPGEVAIPFNARWRQGTTYVYTFVFGDGAGWYPPQPTTPIEDPGKVPGVTPPKHPDPDKGVPVLNSIKFSVTVDEYQTDAANDHAIDMKA